MDHLEKQVKLAEFCGWTKCKIKDNEVIGIPPDKSYYPELFEPCKGTYWHISAPEYFTDDQVIREVYNKLSYHQKEAYVDTLANLVLDKYCLDFNENRYMLAELCMCHPSWRAEALGLTLKLWT